MSEFIKIYSVWQSRPRKLALPAEYCAQVAAEGMAEAIATETVYGEDVDLDKESLWSLVKSKRIALDLTGLDKPLLVLAKGNACRLRDKWHALLEARETGDSIVGYAVPLSDKQCDFLDALVACEHPESANLRWGCKHA